MGLQHLQSQLLSDLQLDITLRPEIPMTHFQQSPIKPPFHNRGTHNLLKPQVNLPFLTRRHRVGCRLDDRSRRHCRINYSHRQPIDPVSAQI